MRLETASTGVIARIFPSAVQSVQLILNFTIFWDQSLRSIKSLQVLFYDVYSHKITIRCLETVGNRARHTPITDG